MTNINRNSVEDIKHSPNVQNILSQKQSRYYKIGMLFLCALLVLLGIMLISLKKDFKNAVANDVKFKIVFFNEEAVCFTSINSDNVAYGSHLFGDFTDIYFLFKYDDHSMFNLLICNGNKFYVSNLLKSSDLQITCEFVSNNSNDRFLELNSHILLNSDRYSIPLVVSKITPIHNDQILMSAYLDLRTYLSDRYQSIPAFINSAIITKKTFST